MVLNRNQTDSKFRDIYCPNIEQYFMYFSILQYRTYIDKYLQHYRKFIPSQYSILFKHTTFSIEQLKFVFHSTISYVRIYYSTITRQFLKTYCIVEVILEQDKMIKPPYRSKRYLHYIN